MDFSNLWDTTKLILDQLITYGPKLLLAWGVLRWWMKVIWWATKIITEALTAWHIDLTIAKFISNLASFILKALLLISVASMIGVETTSFIAIIWAAWLAVGLALQGSLANFAWGVLILMFKPYQVSDRVEIGGEVWKVDEIDILLTKITTRDQKVVIIPNGNAIDDKIINWSKKGPMRIEATVGIGYNESIDAAREVLLEAIKKTKGVLTNPPPSVAVTELGDSSVNLALRAYGSAQDQASIQSLLMENAKKALDAASIEIPFPQRVITTIKA